MKLKNILLLSVAVLIASGIFFIRTSKKTVSCCTQSSIVECTTIKDVLDYVTSQDTLVLFDLDNTLVHPGIELGSDQWFNYSLRQKQAAGLDIQQALKEVLKIYYHVNNFLDLCPVEDKVTLDTLELLHQKGITIFALTTRSLAIAQRTQEQLDHAGIHFSLTTHLPDVQDTTLKNPIRISNGIIFCNDNPKGLALTAALKVLSMNPKAIIFVDDKLSHIVNVEKECNAHNIAFNGLRYGALDELVAQFDPQRAENQLNELLKAHELAVA